MRRWFAVGVVVAAFCLVILGEDLARRSPTDEQRALEAMRAGGTRKPRTLGRGLQRSPGQSRALLGRLLLQSHWRAGQGGVAARRGL